jgi:hypothetical protein
VHIDHVKDLLIEGVGENHEVAFVIASNETSHFVLVALHKGDLSHFTLVIENIFYKVVSVVD